MHQCPGVERFERESERGGEQVGESLAHAGGGIGGESGDAVLGLGFGDKSVIFDYEPGVLHELAYCLCARLEGLGRGFILLKEVTEIGGFLERAWRAGGWVGP